MKYAITILITALLFSCQPEYDNVGLTFEYKNGHDSTGSGIRGFSYKYDIGNGLVIDSCEYVGIGGSSIVSSGNFIEFEIITTHNKEKRLTVYLDHVIYKELITNDKVVKFSNTIE